MGRKGYTGPHLSAETTPLNAAVADSVEVAFAMQSVRITLGPVLSHSFLKPKFKSNCSPE